MLLTQFWNDTLSRFNEVSKSIQKADVNLAVVVNLLQPLKEYTQGLREQFEEYEAKAKIKAKQKTYNDCGKRPTQRSSPMKVFGRPSIDTVLQGSEQLKVGTYLTVIDSLLAGISKRLAAYEHINSLFGFLAELNTMNDGEIEDRCNQLAAHYHKDLHLNELTAECQLFKHYKTATTKPGMLEVYQVIKVDGVESTFPNIEIAIRSYLSTMPTFCTAERTFSKLKLIKNQLRRCVLHPRLNALLILSIESDMVEQIDFAEVVKDFVTAFYNSCSMLGLFV